MARLKHMIPHASSSDLLAIAGISLVSAGAAGLFGAMHDQITFTISPEYFTRMKFEQFSHTDLGLSIRTRVAMIGFLGTWWVGLIAGWFLARLAVARPGKRSVGSRVYRSLCWIIAATVGAGTLGYGVGPVWFPMLAQWNESLEEMGVTDHTAFEQVSGIHSGAYGGAILSWFIAMIVMWRCGHDPRSTAGTPHSPGTNDDAPP
jgi:hypothetical protein